MKKNKILQFLIFEFIGYSFLIIILVIFKSHLINVGGSLFFKFILFIVGYILYMTGGLLWELIKKGIHKLVKMKIEKSIQKARDESNEIFKQ